MKRTIAVALAAALFLALAAVSVISIYSAISRTRGLSTRETQKGILLTPLTAPGGLGEAPEDLLLAALAEDLSEVFTVEIAQGAPLPLSRMARAKKGDSLRADASLDELARAYHRSGHLLLVGVTAAELSARGEDVVGYSQLGGNACIVSTARLAEGASPELLRQRLFKAALHQSGHTFGLTHSSDPQSVMYDAQNLAALDRTRGGFSDDELEELRRHPRLQGRLKQS